MLKPLPQASMHWQTIQAGSSCYPLLISVSTVIQTTCPLLHQARSTVRLTSPPPRRLRYIDCGAYTGDTISSLSRHGLSFDAIAAFEPNPALYPQLCEAASQYNACLFPCGVWSEMTQLRFSPDDAASYFDDTGSVMVQTVTLDQALLNFAPNLIKMDIEGAESAALQGARQLIATYRPHLAISAYHKPRDLWELLLQVQHLDLGYQFRLRTHAHNGFDTVLYATPKP